MKGRFQDDEIIEEFKEPEVAEVDNKNIDQDVDSEEIVDNSEEDKNEHA